MKAFDSPTFSAAFRDKREILLFLGFVAFTFLGIFAGIYFGKNLLDKQQEISKLEGELSSLTEKLGQLSTINRDVEKEAAKAATLALPELPRTITVVASVRSLAQRFGLEITQVRSTTESRKAESFQKSQITFDIIGPIPAIKSLMAQIEDILPFVQVANGEISAENGVVQMKIEAVTSGKKLPANLPDINSAVSDLTRSEQTILSRLIEVARGQQTFTSSPTESTTVPSPSNRTTPFAF